MFDFLTALYPAKDLANIKKVSCQHAEDMRLLLSEFVFHF